MGTAVIPESERGGADHAGPIAQDGRDDPYSLREIPVQAFGKGSAQGIEKHPAASGHPAAHDDRGPFSHSAIRPHR